MTRLSRFPAKMILVHSRALFFFLTIFINLIRHKALLTILTIVTILTILKVYMYAINTYNTTNTYLSDKTTYNKTLITEDVLTSKCCLVTMRHAASHCSENWVSSYVHTPAITSWAVTLHFLVTAIGSALGHKAAHNRMCWFLIKRVSTQCF